MWQSLRISKRQSKSKFHSQGNKEQIKSEEPLITSLFRVSSLRNSSLKNMKIKIEKKNIILSVVLYGYETWTVTLREEYRLRVFEGTLLWRILGPKGEGVAGGWRRLHRRISITCTLYLLLRNNWRRIRWAGRVERMRKSYNILVGKHEGKRPLEKLRHKWEDGIRINRVWTGCIWPTIGTSGGSLWTRQWNFNFHRLSWLKKESTPCTSS